MPKFPLDKVLDYRRHLRLEKRNALAKTLADERELVAHKEGVERKRGMLLGELTELAQAREVDVAATARRRSYLGRLDIEVMILDDHIAQARRRVEIARNELVKADQEVKALEKLKDKHIADQNYVAARNTERDLSEQWQAANWNW